MEIELNENSNNSPEENTMESNYVDNPFNNVLIPNTKFNCNNQDKNNNNDRNNRVDMLNKYIENNHISTLSRASTRVSLDSYKELVMEVEVDQLSFITQ